MCTCVPPRCQYSWLPFLFSSCYHHDNLLTPAQPHTENISLPSPSHMLALLAPSSHPPLCYLALAVLSTLYLHLLSSASPSPTLSPSLPFSSSPVKPTCYILERVPPSTLSSLPKVFHLCRSLFSLLFSNLCSLLIATHSFY